MKSKKKVIIGAITLSVMLMTPTFVQAAFVSYNLPVYGAGNNYYGSVNRKKTNNEYITNYISNDHDSFKRLNCWAANENKTGIGKIIEMSEGQTKQLPHWQVPKVRLVFENSTWVPWSGEVSGAVDYH